MWHFLRFQLTTQLVTVDEAGAVPLQLTAQFVAADEAGAVPLCKADHRPAAPVVFLAVAIDLADNRLKDDQIAALPLTGVAGISADVRLEVVGAVSPHNTDPGAAILALVIAPPRTENYILHINPPFLKQP